MAVLLCAATELEIAPTVDFIRQSGLMKQINIVVTGVGLTAATYNLTKNIIDQRPVFVLQAGIAGALDETIKLGEPVIIKNENIGDNGVLEKESFRSIFNLDLENNNKHPWSNGKLANRNIDLFSEKKLRIVDGVTVNQITIDRDQIVYYNQVLKAGVETMEGAALHYVGLMENMPFLQIRSVSNYIGERDKTKWVMKEAIANLNNELQQLLLNLLKL
ncbi:MAG: futalosine hydrolase [Chitinophagaceae bacterium]